MKTSSSTVLKYTVAKHLLHTYVDWQKQVANFVEHITSDFLPRLIYKLGSESELIRRFIFGKNGWIVQG
jgi:hypothetical protein